MFDAWLRLYERYAAARGGEPGRRVAGILWRWLLDGTFRVAGVIAIDRRKEVVGFAHYRPYPNTLDGTEACHIDDIYLANSHRGTDLAERLIDHICNTARKRGWSRVTWPADSDPDLRANFDRIAGVARDEAATYRIIL